MSDRKTWRRSSMRAKSPIALSRNSRRISRGAAIAWRRDPDRAAAQDANAGTMSHSNRETCHSAGSAGIAILRMIQPRRASHRISIVSRAIRALFINRLQARSEGRSLREIGEAGGDIPTLVTSRRATRSLRHSRRAGRGARLLKRIAAHGARHLRPARRRRLSARGLQRLRRKYHL